MGTHALNNVSRPLFLRFIMSDTTEQECHELITLAEGAVRSCCGLCENSQSHVLNFMHHVGLESQRKGGVLAASCPGVRWSLIKPSTFACTTHTSHFLPAHTQTHTNDNQKLNRWFEVWYAIFLPLMHHEPAHKQRTPTHLLAAATCSFCKHHDHQTENSSNRKHRKENKKTRRGSQTLVYTLPGTSLNRRTKHKLSSLPRSLTTIANIHLHSRGSGIGKYPLLLPRVYICYFRYHPQNGGDGR